MATTEITISSSPFDPASILAPPLHGWRHTAITRMAEAEIPIATIMARAGHCSPKMTAHYTHISEQAERIAMQGMNASRVTPRPPHRPGEARGVDLMDPAIQAEIARQVALLVHQENEERYYASISAAKEQTGPRLVMKRL